MESPSAQEVAFAFVGSGLTDQDVADIITVFVKDI